jgi:hypothetical protein
MSRLSKVTLDPSACAPSDRDDAIAATLARANKKGVLFQEDVSAVEANELHAANTS